MSKVKDLAIALNGKKLPISMIMAGLVAVGVLQAEVGHLKEDMESVEPLKEEVAIIKTDVKNIKENFIDFRDEQRKVNDRMEDNIGKILEAVR